ncbi:MAG TPA: hypothetical protein VJ046_01710 [Candidatus Paceibacterota bacterium]|nr:hypothetical protein [Candidatus Paceibacterota bacterium]
MLEIAPYIVLASPFLAWASMMVVQGVVAIFVLLVVLAKMAVDDF